MGDFFQSVAFIDVAPEGASHVMGRIRTRVVRDEILAAEPGDCVLGDGGGHPPGVRALTVRALTVRAMTVMTGERPITFELAANGVEFVDERHVFYALDGQLRCPGCGVVFEFDEEFTERVSAGYRGDDHVGSSCPSCGFTQRLADWDGPLPWGLAHAGLRFWGWAPLDMAFVAELGGLAESRVRFSYGKL